MDWYFPITLIPGLALLVLSTTNLILGLNLELSQLAEKNGQFEEIIDLKIKQLKRISRAVFWFYMGVFFISDFGTRCSLVWSFRSMATNHPFSWNFVNYLGDYPTSFIFWESCPDPATFFGDKEEKQINF